MDIDCRIDPVIFYFNVVRGYHLSMNGFLEFSLVTENRGSMPVHLQNHLAAGRHVPTIFILNDGMSIGQTAEELVLISIAVQPANMNMPI